MTQDEKNKLFEKMLYLEHMGELQSNNQLSKFCTEDFIGESNGLWMAIDILGLAHEYIAWSYGK